MKKRSKICSLTLVLTILISLLSGIPVTAAQADYTAPCGGVVAASLSKAPEDAAWNERIVFTVVTDTQASKIKICRNDGSIYAFANILDGFSAYTDAGAQRTWSITKRVQIQKPSDFYLYAGNASYEYGAVPFIIKSSGEVEDPEVPITAQELVAQMGIGWNLGNTLDSHGEWIKLYTAGTPADYEQAWGNPVTTKAMVDTVKNAGFDTIRIPVSWYQHLDADNTIDSVWMERVKEVVDYAVANEMFVILNTHHEDAWVTLDGSADYSVMEQKLKTIWTQIANMFEPYSQKLIFEVLNEPRNVGGSDEWSGNAASYALVNRLNTAALEAIRATGGKNSTRCVMIPTYAASANAEPMNAITVPNDDYLIISVHAYTPYSFCTDSAAAYTSSVESSLNYLFSCLKNLREKNNNVPVILGEFGCYIKNNAQDRLSWMTKYLTSAKALGIPCVIWDNGAADQYGILNRDRLTWEDSDYINAIMGIYGR